jgi:hypothetical protein
MSASRAEVGTNTLGDVSVYVSPAGNFCEGIYKELEVTQQSQSLRVETGGIV